MPALLEVDRLTIDARKDDGSLAPHRQGRELHGRAR